MTQGSALPQIKAILFDKDGTLIDFNRTWLGPYHTAADYVAAQSNNTLTAEAILADGGYIEKDDTWQADSLLAAGSNQQIIDRWSSLLPNPFTPEDIATISQIFAIDANAYVPVIDPIDTILQTLKNQGYRLGIATMDNASQAHHMTQGLNIEHYFDFTCGADSGYGVKPEPGMVQAFSKAINIPVEQIAMVGDSPRDIHMGQNAGAALSIGVVTGAHNRQELEKHTPHVLDSIADLTTYLG